MKLVQNVVVAVVMLALVGFVQAADAQKKEKPAKPAVLSGVVVGVSDGKVTVKVAAKAGAESKEVVVETTKDTAVTIDGKAAKVGELAKGMLVKVTPAKGPAEKIVAVTAKPKEPKAKQPKPVEKQ